MQHPRFFFSCLLFLVSTSFSTKPLIAQKTALEVNVGIILDLESSLGKMAKTSISMALEDFYAINHTTKIVPYNRNSLNDSVLAASIAIDLLKNKKVHAILGPQKSNQANFVIEIGNKVKVPIISPATSPAFSPKESQYFIRSAVSSSFQTKAIAALFKAYNWREVVIIYEDTDAGNGFVPYFIDAMRDISTFVTCRTVISPSFTGNQILQELEQLKNYSTRVFVVHMGQLLGSRFFLKAKEAGMMTKGYAWITTDLLTSLFGSMDVSGAESMHGVVGLKPYINMTSELRNFTSKWKKNFHQENPDMDIVEPNAFVLWAYDSTKALAIEIEKVVRALPRFKTATDSVAFTDLDAIGTSDTGPLLIKSLRNFTFKGLSGDFRIVEGELQPPPFEIVNINGRFERVIGYWNKNNGISLELQQNDGAAYSTSKDNLKLVIWPGETTDVTKGWEIPPRSDRKLKIVIPAKPGFSEFVYVGDQHLTRPVNPTGFCIEVFKEVMNAMPYDVPFEFWAHDAPIYDDLVKQVETREYDAAVGDVTILSDRAEFVDFTLPFAESGLAFVVPITADERKNPWIFLKPLTKNLWLTIGAFFVLTGFVVWVLEHRVNKEFRGPPHKQVGIIFWFSFSTLAFAHKENVMSNLTRFVVLVWIFVVLVLTSSYQASLTSMLTVQKLQPSVTTISDLLKNNECVGYQTGSYVQGFLNNTEFKCIKNYTTLEDYDEALSKGSKKGGVTAIADELPYIRLFLAKHPEKYTILSQIYHTAGFGFVFPKGSPLASDVSRAVLKVTEGKQMMNITKRYFGEQKDRLEKDSTDVDSTDVDSGSLTLESFKGLFLVAAVTFTLALVIYFVIFIHENIDIVISNDTFLEKLSKMGKAFDMEKEDPSVARKPSDEGNEENEVHIDTQVSENWPSPSVSPSHQIDEVFSTPEPGSPVHGSPVHDTILTPQRRGPT